MINLEALIALLTTELYFIDLKHLPYNLPCNKASGDCRLCCKLNLLRQELRHKVENLCRDINCEHYYFVQGIGLLTNKELALQYATKVSGTHDPYTYVEEFLCIPSSTILQLLARLPKGKGRFYKNTLKDKGTVTSASLFFVFLMEAFKLGLRHHEFRTLLRNFLRLALPHCKVVQEHFIARRDKVDVLVECNDYCAVFEVKSPEDMRVAASKNIVDQLIRISNDLGRYCQGESHTVFLIETRGNLPQRILAEFLKSTELYDIRIQQNIQPLSADIVENLLKEDTNIRGATLEDFLKRIARKIVNTLDYVK